MIWFEELRQVNADLLKAAKAAKAEEWLRRSAVEKYAEPTHFIFELLQNADDQEAKRVKFRLLPDRVEFCHWGKQFKRVDVERITRLGDSGKRHEEHKIGNFGIGFKSVFAVTDRPEVYCKLDGKPFAFAMEDLVVPVALEPMSAQGDETLFVLPYTKKERANLSAEAAEQLAKTGPEVLMFLNHIAELSWEDAAGNGEKCRCIRERDGVVQFERSGTGNNRSGKINSSSYRLFRCAVTLPDGRKSEACVAFRLNAEGHVISERVPAKLWVYFETEEPTGLRFRLHGPFKLTDSRANIMRAEPFNKQVIEDLAALAASALTQLRDEGRLVRESLNAFPIPADELRDGWKNVGDALWQVMREEEVLPKAAGDCAKPSSLWQGTQELRAVFEDSDLATLFGGEKAWAVSAGQRHSRIDRLLSHVRVEELNLEGLHKQLAAASSRRGGIQAWLSSHDDEWLQRLYQLLNGIKGYQATSLGHLPIVRAADGKHLPAADVRFAPAEERKHSEVEVEGVRLVAPSVLSGKKQTREEVEQFLRRIGVKDVDEEDYIRALLGRHYRPGGTVSDAKAHLRHIERFAAWIAGRPYETALFQGAALFLSDDSDQLHAPSALYFDNPFYETGLAAVYGAGATWANKKKPLSKRYRGLKGVVDFARRLGVTRSLMPARTTTHGHPERNALWADYYRSSARMGNSTNVDWTISGLEQLLAQPDPLVSLCLWRSLQSLDRPYFFAKFRHAESKPIHEKPASFVYQLKAIRWIPSASGQFHKPEDITEAELPPEFDTTDRTGWLDAIGFGTKAKRKAAEYQEQRRTVIRAGIPDEFAERFQELSDDERRSVLEAGFRDLETSEPQKPEFPEHESPNPDRRSAKVAESAEGAPEKRREVRDRTVRVDPPGHRENIRAYLADLYTNPDGEMVCQCCRDEMPFRLANGSYYFEAVEFVGCDRELDVNHLALCPLCAAKYKNACTTPETDMRTALLESETSEIPLMLAGKPECIKFVKDHKDDLLSALGILNDKRQRSA